MTPERWQQIDQLFHATLACDPAKRSGFLSSACDGDEQLRLEVESLIASHEQGQSFIEKPAGDVAAEMLGTYKSRFEPGQQIDDYRIVRHLGSGGMGEVYLAVDTKLGRQVALKLLPEVFTKDVDRVKRFKQEARAASALNHPNILTIYEINNDSYQFIATEFVDGQTLRQRLMSGALGTNEALSISDQIASALVAAHAEGIVHRDIKPENIMLRHDGIVKVLDFGLAKLSEDRVARTHVMTQGVVVKTNEGIVMGTTPYLSPEQARGHKVDARTDIFSLGAVLYEMIAGEPVFKGETPSDIVASVLRTQPPLLSSVAPDVPPALDIIVTKTLEKDREKRYQSVKEMLVDLRRLRQRREFEGLRTTSEIHGSPHRTSGSTTTVPSSARDTRIAVSTSIGSISGGRTISSSEAIVAKIKTHKRGFAIALIAAVILCSFGVIKLIRAGFGLGHLFDRKSSPVASLHEMKFTKIPISSHVEQGFLSPDGRFIALVVREKSKSSLRLRQVTAAVEREIVPAFDGYFLSGITFSPDGNSIYYVIGETGKTFRRLYRISVLGGDPQKLIDDVDSAVTVSPDGKRLAFRRHNPQSREDMLMLANEDGSDERVIATKPPPAVFGKPKWSPDGKVLAHPVFSRDEQGEYLTFEAADPSDHSTVAISTSKWFGVNSIEWLPDKKGLIVTGKPRSAPKEDGFQIWYAPFPGGEPQKITNDANNYWGLTLTADARTALVGQTDLASNVWVVPASDFARSRQVTNTNGQLGELCWTSQGQIVYSHAGAARYMDLWMMNSDGTGNRQLTFTSDRHEHEPSLSHDERHVVFMTFQAGVRSIWRMDIDGGEAKELVHNVGGFGNPHFSPDSQWVYYNSRDETGNMSFWRVPFDGGPPVKVRDKSLCRLSREGRLFICAHRDPVPEAVAKVLVVSADSGEVVRTLDWPKDAGAVYWSPDGQAVDFIAERNGYSNVWRLPLEGGKEQKLTDWQASLPIWHFAWSPDGRQLAVTRDTQNTELILIENFR